MSSKLQLLAEHIAKGNPSGLDSLAIANGLRPGKTIEGRMGFVHAFVQKRGEAALKELSLIHPDRELILDSVTKSSNADGTTETIKTTVSANKTEEEKPKLTNLLIIIIMAILLIAILNDKI